jgi:MFS family permease
VRRLHYAWIVAAVTWFTILFASGFRSTPSTLIVPLQQEFGWSRAEISLAVSINLVCFGLFAPFAGGLMERFGVRRVTLAALLLVSTGSASTIFMRAPWQLDLLWGIVVGVGTGSMASVLGAIVANRWFVQRRGVVLGALTAAGATGQLIFLPGLAWLAVNLGWRWAALSVAGAALLGVPLIALVMRERPADVGLRPYGATQAEEPAAPRRNAVRAALGGLGMGARNRNFWFLAASFFICGASTNGLIGTHLIPASIDHGLPEVTAAGLLATIGVFDVAGTMISGWLTDRLDSRWLLFWYYGLRGLSLLFLPYAFGLQYFGLILFIVFYGLDWVATVPPTIALTADTFGKRNLGVVYGWIFASHQLGAAAAAFGAGAVRTWFGDYQLAFMTSGLLCLLAAGIVVRISRGPSGALAQPPVPAPSY